MASQSPSESPEQYSLALTKREPDLVLLIFIHGFKGTDETFGEFPQRLQHLLSETLQSAVVEAIVFPAYETKGELDKAVVRFADWLTTLTVKREVASGFGAGKAKVVLCGHSMGGLLSADTLREFVNSRPDKDAPLWPSIVACITFDTPFCGLHPFVVKNSVTKVAQYANAATTIGSAVFGSFAGFGAKKVTQTTNDSTPSQSVLGKWAGPAAYAVGGAILAGAAAGGAYYKKDDLTQGFSWATDHMKYVGNLWDEAGLEQRLNALLDIEREHGVIFRNLYSLLPANPPEHLTPRTFVVLPKHGSRSKDHFLPQRNGIAPDEIQGHTGMFGANTNDGYYQLGLASANIIGEAVRVQHVKVTNRPTTAKIPHSRTKSPTTGYVNAT